MQEASHRVVHEERRVGDFALPFSFGWDMLRVRHDSIPFATRHDLGQLVLDEGATGSLQCCVLRKVHDELHLFLVDTLVVMHFSFVTNGLQPVKMEVQVEVS